MSEQKKQSSTERRLATFGHPWEKGDVYGFAPAVQVSNRIYVAGQTAANLEGGMEAQMREAYAAIEAALAQLGAAMSDVVDETLFVTDMDATSQCAASVRSDVFKGRFDMASTLVGVAKLGHPDCLIEIKCTAEL